VVENVPSCAIALEHIVGRGGHTRRLAFHHDATLP
jgi:hypothetical protein